MTRTSPFLPLLALSLLGVVAAAGAQTTSKAPSDAPPKMEQIQDGSDTPITVTAQPNQKNSITTQREQGQVKEVKVVSGPSTYYLHPGADGTSVPGDITNNGVHGPMWKVFDFNLGSKAKKEKDEAAAADAPAPPDAGSK